MMRWLKDKKKERRSNSASYDDDGKEDDYGFEKERVRAASKSPSTRRQLPPTPAMPEEKSPHIYEEIPDVACSEFSPTSQQVTDAHTKKSASAAKKAGSSGKAAGENASKLLAGGGKASNGNKYTSDISSAMLIGGGSKPKKTKLDDTDSKGQYIGPSFASEQSRQTPPNLHRNGTPEVHCDVIIKDTHCEILLSRKPKSGGGGGVRSDCSNGGSASSSIPHNSTRTSSTGEGYPPSRSLNSTSSWSQQPDVYVGPQGGRYLGQLSSRDRRASVDVHSSSKFTSAFSLASNSSSTAAPNGGASNSSAGAHTSGPASFSSSTSRLNSLGGCSSFSVLNFSEPYQPKTHGNLQHQPQNHLKHQNHHLYQHMQAPTGEDENSGAGESAGSVSSSAKGVETYTTASNFIARPTIVPFNPLPGAKDPCVEAFGRPLSTGSSSTDGAYASIRDDAVEDSAYHAAPLQNCPHQPGGASSSVTYASIQDTEKEVREYPTSAGHGACTSAKVDQHQELFYGEHHRMGHIAANGFQQSKTSEPSGHFQSPVRAGIIHGRSPSDSSSCTYASVSFPTEPKHYNTIPDLGKTNIQVALPEDRRRSNGTAYMGAAPGSKPHQAFPPGGVCDSDSSDGIYSGVAPYRINKGGFDKCAAGGIDVAANRGSNFTTQRHEFSSKTRNQPAYAQQNIYADISSDQEGGANSDIYTSIDPTNSVVDPRKTNSASDNSKVFTCRRDSNSLFSSRNDLHRYAVDRTSFHIDFCTCSDDHASSCGFGDLTSPKSGDHSIARDKTNNLDAPGNALLSGTATDVSKSGNAGRSEYIPPGSCKDCGRLIKQITYSESYSDETYEHVYSSRLLTRNSRRYSSPDITFSEISNSEFNNDLPNNLHYRSSPSWSRRSPGNEARISRDDTWASSPRSDDIIPPAYGALDDNGFISSHYERWSPIYNRNRDRCSKDAISSAADPSPTCGQRRSRPWIAVAPFSDELLGQNMADDAKTRLHGAAGNPDAGSAFFTPNSYESYETNPSVYCADKENNEPKTTHLLTESLEVVLPEGRSEISRKKNSRALLEQKNNPRLRGTDGKEKSKNPSSSTDIEENQDSNSGRNALDLIETRDHIPNKNTKKLANYFQNLSSSKDINVGSEDSMLPSQIHEDSPSLRPKSSKQRDLSHKASAFMKLPTHSASFCAPKMADSKRSTLLSSSDQNNLGSQSSPDVSKSRNRRDAENKVLVASLVPNAMLNAPTLENQNLSLDKDNSMKQQSDVKRGPGVNKNDTDDTSNGQKPQNKTDSGDTCYEFDISTSSEGEQQTSYDNILSKVHISLNLEQELQHIADSRAARRKRLLCRRCKKQGTSSSTNVYSIIDDASRDSELLGANGNGGGIEGSDLGFMLEDDGMCPHLSLKFGELRAMLDNMFVDQRAAILDCLTDQAAAPNPYSFKTGGGHGLHLCGQELESLPAALQQLCRECGCEVMTSDTESITTVYSGSMQGTQPGAQLRMTSPGSGPPTHTPSCDSDEGTMADNSGDDDDDVSDAGDKDVTKAKLLQKNSQWSCYDGEGKLAGRKNPSPFDPLKSHKHSHHKVLVSGSINNDTTINSNYNNNKGGDDDEVNYSSGYDEPEDQQRQHQYPVSRHERSTHRTKKKDKRDRKTASAHSHGVSCGFASESRPTRRSVSHSQTVSQAQTIKATQQTVSSDKTCQQSFLAEEASKGVLNGNYGVQLRKAGSKKNPQCASSSPYCFSSDYGSRRHNHSHSSGHFQERSRAPRDTTADPSVYDTEKDDDSKNCQQSASRGTTSACSTVSDKALKDIYSPLPAKALCLLTSRQNNNNNNSNNNNNNNNNNKCNINDTDGIININNSGAVSSNSSSSSISLVGKNVGCTCGKTEHMEFEGGDVEHLNQQELCSLSSVSSRACVPPHSSLAMHKENMTTEQAPGIKDEASEPCSTNRETEDDKEVISIKDSLSERVNEETSYDEKKNTNASVGGTQDEGKTGEISDRIRDGGGRTNKVQTHLAPEKAETRAGLCECCTANGSYLPRSDMTPAVVDSVYEKCEDLCTKGEVGCCCNHCGCSSRITQQERRSQAKSHHQSQHNHHLHNRHNLSGRGSSSYIADNRPQFAIESTNEVSELAGNPHVPRPLSNTKPSVFPKPVVGSKYSLVEPPQEMGAFEGRERGGREDGHDYSRRDKKNERFDNGLGITHADAHSSSDNINPNGEGVNKGIEHSAEMNGKPPAERSGRNTAAMGALMADETKGRMAQGTPVSNSKPHTTRTTAEPATINSLPGAREGGECENQCSSTPQGVRGQQCENPLSKDGDCEHGQAIFKPVGAGRKPFGDTLACPDMQMKSSGSLLVSPPPSHKPNSTVASSASVNSPTVRVRSMIHRKHKLELATLDLLPETALGGDVTEPDIDIIRSAAFSPHAADTGEANTSSALLKPRAREREATTVVQKMAKLFEENAIIKHADDSHSNGHNIGSPRGQRSCRVGFANPTSSASKLDGKSEQEVGGHTKPGAGESTLATVPSDSPLSVRVSSVQSSSDIQTHRSSQDADKLRAMGNEKSPDALSRSTQKCMPGPRSSQNTFLTDCPGEERLKVSGVSCPGAWQCSDQKPYTPGSCLNQAINKHCKNKSLHQPDAESTGQVMEHTSKERRLRAGVGERKTTEEGDENYKETENSGSTEIVRQSKPRGSKLKHSELVMRLKNAKDSRSGVERRQACSEDSSSASSSPSSTKKATTSSSITATVGSAEFCTQDPPSVSTGSASNHAQHGKQKRYSKKPYHKRRSKSRSTRRRSGSRVGGDREERTYYYFSSDLSDIDVVEVDDWETYATSLTAKKPTQSSPQARAGKEHGVEPSRAAAGRDSPIGGNENSPLVRPRKKTTDLSINAKSKSRVSRDLKDTESTGNTTTKHHSLIFTEDVNRKQGVEEDEETAAMEERETYSCISPTPTGNTNSTSAAAAVGASPASSPMASPELPKPRRNRRSANPEGGGKSNNPSEVYKSKRRSSDNKLLSELIIRNYDMQIYGNV